MPYARTQIPARIDRLAVVVLFALLCLATLSIWAEASWPLSLVEAGLSALFLVWFPLSARESPSKDISLPLGGMVLLTSWGFLQYFSGHTSYAHATREASLQWFSVLLTFTLSARLFRYPALRHGFLTALVWVALALGVLELAGAARPSGDFLWLLPTGRERLYGAFPYYNNFAQFQELVLPIAVFRAIAFGGGRAYCFAAGILYASVIVSGSRAGAILATAEVFTILAISAAARHMGWRAAAVRLSAIASVAAVLTLVAWGDLGKRFEQDHPLAQRALLNRSSLDMIREHPLMGFGLGTYPYVYPSFARFDVGRYVNHAHNDWAEWAAEGGLPFAACLLGIAAVAFGPALVSSWGVGLIAVGIHAMVDYPFQRFGLEAWIFALLAAVLAERPRRVASPAIVRVYHSELEPSVTGELV